MKILISCSECLLNSFPDIEKLQVVYSSYELINDSGAYKVECPQGHTTSFASQELKFEILFEIGFFAISDGYYREAVNSFTSALERFYEFYIKVISAKNGVLLSEYEKMWKPLSKQSERQLGAFTICYFLENKVSPLLLNQKKTEFRNEVIHKGKIPTRTEAMDYGKAIASLILPIIKDLLEKDYEIVSSFIVAELSEKLKVHSHTTRSTSGSNCVFLSLVLGDDANERDFEQHLAVVERQVERAKLSSLVQN